MQVREDGNIHQAKVNMNAGEVVLRQHLRDGSQRSSTLQLSLDDNVISYGIRRKNDGPDADGHFELIGEPHSIECLAIMCSYDTFLI